MKDVAWADSELFHLGLVVASAFSCTCRLGFLPVEAGYFLFISLNCV